MARKNKQLSNGKKDRLSTVLMHAHALNLYSIVDYQTWCIQQGFRASINKTQSQLNREYQHYKFISAHKKLKNHKRESNTVYFINRIFNKQIKRQELNSETLRIINHGFNKTQNRRLLRDVLIHLNENSKLLNRVDHVKGIINFVGHFKNWLQPIYKWQANTHNADRQFASLTRHLFAKYEVPTFMDTVWQKDNTAAMSWFIHIGKGNNMGSAEKLPVKMTKKMAHYFLQAPPAYDAHAAFRWAQIHALGGNRIIADAITETRLITVFNDDEFWLSVFRFFIANPMLDTKQINPIIDFIWHQKFENRMVFVERGVVREEAPEQPGFSMKGRSADTLLRQVENWHKKLGKESRGGNLQWVKSKFTDFRYVEGRANRRNMKIWTIQELLSNKELVVEGRKQNHCVATYASSCFSGSTSIWTMDACDNVGSHKLLTIELHNATKTIRQVRGLRNRTANKTEMDIIRRWAAHEGLKFTKYI